MKPSPVFLLAEDDPEIREILAEFIRSRFGAQVIEAGTGREAIEQIDSHPEIACVISDYQMPEATGDAVYQHLLLTEAKLGKKIPFILCSAYGIPKGSALEKTPPAAVIQKPEVLAPLTLAIQAVLPSNPEAEADPSARYCKVSLSGLLRCGRLLSDIYTKLGGSKWIRIYKSGDVFNEDDLKKLRAKGVTHLYFKAADATKLLSGYLAVLVTPREITGSPIEEQISRTHEFIEITQEIVSALGMTEEARVLVRKATRAALHTLSRASAPAIVKLLACLEQEPESYLSVHSFALIHVASMLAIHMGWKSDLTFHKLALASLLHDVTLDSRLARHSSLADLALSVLPFTNEETLRFARHPDDAAELLNHLSDVPADVELILRQHHARPDGSGFPSLDAKSITPLSSLFIVAHDLLRFQLENRGATIMGFLSQPELASYQGTFGEIFKVLSSSLTPAET